MRGSPFGFEVILYFVNNLVRKSFRQVTEAVVAITARKGIGFVEVTHQLHRSTAVGGGHILLHCLHTFTSSVVAALVDLLWDHLSDEELFRRLAREALERYIDYKKEEEMNGGKK